jgi:hypothetical protein
VPTLGLLVRLLGLQVHPDSRQLRALVIGHTYLQRRGPSPRRRVARSHSEEPRGSALPLCLVRPAPTSVADIISTNRTDTPVK